MPSKKKPIQIKEKLYDLFGADLRSLAVLRIGLAALLLADLINRAQDLIAYYTDAGILPRQTLLDLASNPWHFSLHLLSGQWEFQAALFIIAAIFAVMLLLGYKARLAAIASWILLISLQNRNPIILHNSDTLIRVTLFWVMFLPLGEVFSLDRARKHGTNALASYRIFSVATVGYLAQMMFLYIFAVMFKTGPDWHQDGTAIYYALSDEAFTRTLGYTLLNFPALLKVMTRATFWFEAIGPWLLIIPFGTAFFRTVAVFGFIALHAGIGLTMHLGMFPWTSAIVMLGLLPPGFWNFLNRLRRARAPLTLYYDSECGFCKNAAHLFKTFLILDTASVAVAHNDPRILEAMTKNNSWVIENGDGTLHQKFDGFLVMVRQSPLFWPLAILLNNSLCHRIGTRLYEYIAGHRRVACSLHSPVSSATPVPKKSRTIKIAGTVLGVFFIWYILVWNLSTLPNAQHSVPTRLVWIGHLLRLDQMWNMFSPGPPHAHGWYVIPGQLTNGNMVDIFRNGAPVDFAKPITAGGRSNVSSSYPDYRWQKFLLNLADSGYTPYRLPYGQYLCRSWNASHTGTQTLQNFQIYYIEEINLPNGQKTPPRPIVLWQHQCF